METDRIKVRVNFLEEIDQRELIISQYNEREELRVSSLNPNVFFLVGHELLCEGIPTCWMLLSN